MNLSGNDKNKITGKKYQPVMSVTGLNDQGLNESYPTVSTPLEWFVKQSKIHLYIHIVHYGVISITI